MPARRFLFICGCARSGTSVLARILNAHGAISIGMERYLGRSQKGNGMTPDLFEEERFFTVMKGDTWYENLERFNNLYPRLRKKWARSIVVGDKQPKLYTSLDQVFERFPDARVIFIARNVIDIASSYKRRATNNDDDTWPSERDADMAIDDWNAAIAKTLAAARRHPRQVHVLRYENLFVDEKASVDDLFDFIGLKVSPEVRKFYRMHQQKSSKIRSGRVDNLSPAEKLEICLRADFDSFKKLLQRTAPEPGKPPATAAAKPAAGQAKVRAQAGKAAAKPAGPGVRSGT
jgi:hypothetical protein